MLNRQKLSALEQIREASQGLLTPQAVVEAAGDPRNPLHSEFTWDNDQAGHLYRLDQARTLIRSVTIVRLEEERVITSVYYTRCPTLEPREPGYIPVDLIKRNRQDSLDALDYELARIEGAILRAKEIAMVLGLDEYFATMLKQLAEIRRKKKAA